MVAGSKGLNRKTVSFVMTDADVQQCLVRELKQPTPPARPRSERGFIRNHFPHLRLSSHGDKKQRQHSHPSQVAPEEESFSLAQQNSFASGDDDSTGDSLSAVLLANSQPLGKRLGSLDRPLALQKTSLGVLGSHASKALLDNGGGGGSMSSGPSGNAHYLMHEPVCDFACGLALLHQIVGYSPRFYAHWKGHGDFVADGDIEALLDFDQQDLLPMIKAEDGTILFPKGPRWPQPRRRSSLINNPLAMKLAESLVHRSEHDTRAEQYSPPMSAYGSALVSELRQDDHESFFSDKSETEAEAPTLAAALGARRSSLLMLSTSHPSCDSTTSMRNRRPVSRHASHIGYSQPGKVLSRLRRSSNEDDEMFPAKLRRRSDETSLSLPGT